MAIDRIKVRAMFLRALEAGARQISPLEVEWDAHGPCLMPVRREVSARKGQGFSIEKLVDLGAQGLEYVSLNYGVDRTMPYAVYLTVRCRMCDACLRERKKLWARRAVAEMSRAARTWFGTYTLSPEWQSYFGAKAAMEASRNGDVLEALPFDQQLILRHQAISPEFTKYLKRLRKRGHRLRYLLVLEAHKTMLPHYHVLIHESGAPVPKRVLEDEWRLGFSQFRLAEDARAVFYAAKYLGKSSAARVRASLHYGRVAPPFGAEGATGASPLRPVVLTT